MSESTTTFFVEYDQVMELIQYLPIIDSSSLPSSTTTTTIDTTNTKSKSKPIQNGNQALSKLKRIFDKYLECPTLLDSKLESILTFLSKASIVIIHELYDFLLMEKQQPDQQEEEEVQMEKDEDKEEKQENYDDDKKDNNNKESNNNTSTKNQQKHHHYNQIIILKRYMSTIYTISKVRGYKHVSKYLSHETKDVEPVLCMLRHVEDIVDGKYELKMDDKNTMGNEVEIAEYWESVYVLLLWLGMLSLVPFNLNTIDSAIISTTTTPSTTTNNNKIPATTTLISSMITTIQNHLNDPGPTRVIASSSLAKLYSRPDLEQDELKSFVLFSNKVLLSYLSRSNRNNEDNINHNADDNEGQQYDYDETTIHFLVMGIIQTLANIFKTGNRSTLMKSHLSLVEILWENTIVLSEQLCGSGGSSSTSLVLRKFLVKLFARVGCSYLPPRIASWRYQRGKRSLLENLSKAVVETKQASTDTSANTTTTNDDQEGSNHVKNETQSHNNVEEDGGKEEKVKNDEDDNDFFHVPDQVEDSMAQLMSYLTDSATTVRWSAAKGIGRLTERLPILCADDVLDALLELCSNEQNYENDCIWHGSCLTLAELARRGLLLPHRLNEVIPIVIQAIQYDVPKGSHSVGSHVRDAACYVCWAFARAYAPSVLEPYVKELSKAIVVASLFDREINCRRAASASFQECVGRQGANNFKHGIAILTTADYFTLGNRVEAFTTIAKKIAVFEEYRHPIIDHLYEEKLFHWDVEIRKLSSISLRMLTSLEPEYFTKTLLPNLLPLCTNENLTVRHGAVLGIAEIILALGGSTEEHNEETNSIVDKSNLVDLLSDEQKGEVANVVTQIEKARLYRGRGGEIMRAAVSRYIECLSKSRIPLTVKQQVGLLDSLDVNLKHPNEGIQRAAARALSALMTWYFPVSSNGPSERLQNRVVNNYVKLVREEENPAATRGYALALGHLPSKLVAFNKEVLDSVINCLCNAADQRSMIGQQGDAETRRNAIESIVRLCESVGIGGTGAVSCKSNYPVVGIDVEQTQRIFNCLLECIQDYNTDRRGDVGSWSRIAAMKGLVIVTFLSIRASDIPQQSDSESEKKNSYELMIVPSFQERMSLSFEANASTAVQESIVEGRPYRTNQQTSERHVYFDDQICAKVLGAILKQLAEKLDAVRLQAGTCLEQLLAGPNMIPFVPRKQMLLEGLHMTNNVSNERNFSWGNPDLTFPLLMKVINIDAFFHSILSGLVISVGGLTESVTNSSSKAFLDYCRILKQSKLIGKLSKIGKSFLKLFDDHPKDNRVILPLLVTIDKVLSHGYLDCLFEDKRSDFPKELVTRIRREASRCSDIKRIMAIVPVALGTLHTHDKDYAHKTIFPFVMRLLGHRFPRIRKYTAEQLYIKLLEDDSIVPNTDQIEQAQMILTDVVWDRELGAPGNVRESRNQIADLLGIQLSEKDRNGPTTKQSVKKPIDAFASYQSLVESAGR